MAQTLIIFDIDGTLLYSNKVDSQCFADTYKDQFGFNFPSIDWNNYPHVTDTTIFNSVFEAHFHRLPAKAELHEFKLAFVDRLHQARQERPTEFNEVPGARDTLSRLQDDKRYELGIATGGFELPARLKLDFVGINTDDFHMSFADEKPTRQDIIRESMDQAHAAGGDFDHIVYIGDALWDVRTTRSLKMNFVGIRRLGDADTLLMAGANEVLQDYNNFDRFLEAVHQAKPPIEE